MKKILTIVMTIVVINCHAQNNYIVYGSQFLSGASTGISEQVNYHPEALFKQFPRLNRQWWDIRISYTNKYHESPLLVEFSDANHFFKALSLSLNCVSVGFCFGDLPKKKKFWFIAKKMLLAYAFNKAGFAVTYYGVFKNNWQ